MSETTSDYQLAWCADAAYRVSPTFAVGDLHAMEWDGVGESVIAIRGSTADPRDWLRDADAFPVEAMGLGFCHPGFLGAARALMTRVGLDRLSGTILTGHSLGGAIAVAWGALAARAGAPPLAIVTFGAPRVGGVLFQAALQHVPMRLYRNGNDPVTEIPWLPPVYAQPRPLISIGVPEADPFAAHAITAYLRALGPAAARTA